MIESIALVGAIAAIASAVVQLLSSVVRRNKIHTVHLKAGGIEIRIELPSGSKRDLTVEPDNIKSIEKLLNEASPRSETTTETTNGTPPEK